MSGLGTVAGGETVGGFAHEAGRCPRAVLPRDDRPPLIDLQDEEIVAPGGEETMSVTTVRVHAAALAGTLHAMGCTSTASTNARQR